MPTILTRRSLLCRVPFRNGLKKHQDWDWVLRAAREGARILFCPEVLAKCEMRTCASVSRRPDWRCSLKWIHDSAQLVTRRAYGGFIATHVAWQAAAQREWSAFFPLFVDAWRNGALRRADVVRYLGFWLVPPRARHRLQRFVS